MDDLLAGADDDEIAASQAKIAEAELSVAQAGLVYLAARPWFGRPAAAAGSTCSWASIAPGTRNRTRMAAGGASTDCM